MDECSSCLALNNTRWKFHQCFTQSIYTLRSFNLFALLGSASIKAMHKMLMKSTPGGGNFISILHVAFLYKSVLRNFSLLTCFVCNFSSKINWKKTAPKILMKLTIPSSLDLASPLPGGIPSRQTSLERKKYKKLERHVERIIEQECKCDEG